MILPTFFVLGAAHCGTTSLHHYLSQHPDICMSDPKEPLFFEAEYGNGQDYYLEKYFAHHNGERVVGESRHRNLFLGYVPRRIEQLVPGPRFIAVVRHPVERAHSHWWYWHARGLEKDHLNAALEANYRRMEEGPLFESEDEAELYAQTLDHKTGFSPYPTYIDTGHYDQQIERYIALFGRDAVKVVIYEDFARDTSGTLEEIYAFLEVAPVEGISLARHNSSMTRTGTRLFQLLTSTPLHRRLPQPWRIGLKAAYTAFFSRNHRKDMEAGTRRDLLDHYEPHTTALEEMLGRDLSAWRQ